MPFPSLQPSPHQPVTPIPQTYPAFTTQLLTLQAIIHLLESKFSSIPPLTDPPLSHIPVPHHPLLPSVQLLSVNSPSMYPLT